MIELLPQLSKLIIIQIGKTHMYIAALNLLYGLHHHGELARHFLPGQHQHNSPDHHQNQKHTQNIAQKLSCILFQCRSGKEQVNPIPIFRPCRHKVIILLTFCLLPALTGSDGLCRFLISIPHKADGVFIQGFQPQVLFLPIPVPLNDMVNILPGNITHHIPHHAATAVLIKPQHIPDSLTLLSGILISDHGHLLCPIFHVSFQVFLLIAFLTVQIIRKRRFQAAAFCIAADQLVVVIVNIQGVYL